MTIYIKILIKNLKEVIVIELSEKSGMSTRTKAIIAGTICAIAGTSIIVFFSYRCIK